jgi:hypothetical protein
LRIEFHDAVEECTVLAAIPVVIAILYLPGYLGFRIANLNRSFSLMAAPVLSVALYALLGNLYSVARIGSNAISIFAILTVLLLVAAFLCMGRRQDRTGEGARIPVPVILFAAIFGLAVGAYVFVLRLPRTDAVFQGWDNVTHLNYIRAFIDSGDWSSLHPTSYLADPSIQPVEQGGFYPAAWHELCALTVLMSGATVAKAVNAVNYILCSLVYPLGAVAALRMIFGDRSRVLYAGAIVSVSFAQFPWSMLVFGPIYSNLAAFCLVPTAFAVTYASINNLFEHHEAKRYVFMILAVIIALGFLQPSAVFLLAVLLFFYLGHRIYSYCASYRMFGRSISSKACMNIFYLVCLVLWIAVYLSPITANMLQWRWLAFTNSWQEIINILTAGYGYGFGQNTPAQLLLALMVTIGLLSALRKPNYQWVVQTYVLACIFCFVDATLDGLLKDVLCSIWYADPSRLASICAIAAMPLAALGLADTADFCVRKLAASRGEQGLSASAVTIGVAACFIALNFARFYAIPGWESAGIVDAYSALDSSAQKFYSIESSEMVATALTQEERDFAAKAQEYIPEGSVVINDPSDGSVLLYGLQGVRCYYRGTGGYRTNETETSKIIRTHLKDIAKNEKVREAVHSIGAKYVLILDSSNKGGSFLNFMGANFDIFHGIADITDTTPGFKLLLAEGPMRLYEIEE